MKYYYLLFVLVILPIVACADPVEINGIWYNLIPKGNAAEVTSNPNHHTNGDEYSYAGEITIPESVEYDGYTYNVVSILGGAFSLNSELTAVTIPNSITKIGQYAFSGCENLKSVSIGNKVGEIGEYAFNDCKNLESVYITDLAAWLNINFCQNVQHIGELSSQPLIYAKKLYINNVEVKELTFPETITSVNNEAFYGYCGLISLEIPSNVTSIGERSFRGCKNLNSIILHDGITFIPDGAFCGCSSLSSLTIPNSVTRIGDFHGTYSGGAFEGCISLTSITFPNNLSSIGDCAFRGCSGLTSLTIPNSVTKICAGAFMGCSSLTSITIPNNVTQIQGDSYAGGAFQNCSNLVSLILGENIVSIGEKAFGNCNKLEDVYCYAEEVPSIATNALESSYIEYITLHVPAILVSDYRGEDGDPYSYNLWSNFKEIVALDGALPETPKCAKPEINFANGKVSFSCATEGVEYISEVTVTDAHKYYDSEIDLSQTYKVSVFATKTNYINSDVTTREIIITGNGKAIVVGDVDGDGKVNAADHVKLSNIIMEKL